MKFLGPIVMLILVVFTYSACSDHEKEGLLKVGISPWPGYEPLILAAKKGYFKDANIRIISFSTPTESYRALRDGIVDVSAFTADEVFHYAEVRDKPRIFLVLDISNGADAIVAKPSIKTLDDLKGKRLGVEGSALGDYVINRSLDFAKNLKLSDIDLKSVEIDSQEKAYLANEIDAAVTFEPSKSLLIKAGAHILFDSSQIPNEIVDVLVTNEKVIQEHPESLELLALGWFKALEYIKRNYKQSMQSMSESEDLNAKEFQKAYEDLIIPTQQENKKMLGRQGSLIKPMQRLSNLMFEKGSLNKKIDIVPLLDDRIIDAIQE